MSHLPADERVKKMTKILGLTGGIASGKSTVSNYLKELNIPIVDADIVARDVMRAGTPTVKKIAEQFGAEVLLENGEINRELLGQIIFTYPEKRKQLNDIVQDEIKKELLQAKKALLAAKPPLLVLDIPLLLEEGYETSVDEVMVVYVDKPTQKERLLKRNPELSEEDALNRIYSQMPLEDKAKLADVLIDNNGTIKQTCKQVETWLKTNFGEAFVSA